MIKSQLLHALLGNSLKWKTVGMDGEEAAAASNLNLRESECCPH